MRSQKVVTPVKSGVQKTCNGLKALDSGFRRNDRKRRFPTSYETIKVEWRAYFFKITFFGEEMIRLISLSHGYGMNRISRFLGYEIPKAKSLSRRCALRHDRSWTMRRILLCCIFLSFISPPPLLALGEYNGIWIGPVTVSIAGEQVTETTGSILYQEDVETLSFWDSMLGVVRLEKSGSQWFLPSPLQTTLLGIPITLNDFTLTFQSTSSATGSATVTASGETGSATYTLNKRSCTTLTNGSTLSGLSGAEESYQCYQINIPVGATNLNVQTSGGTGDCDLFVGYHKPDFDVQLSEGDVTQEQVQIASPQSGLWYIVLVGYTSFSGVNLNVSYQALSAPVAEFKADQVSGLAPLRVAFTDLSTGTITARTWNFGDGSGSSESNPTHTYAIPGVYGVRLTVTGPGGTDTETKDNFIETLPRKSMPWLPLLLDD